MFNSSSLVETVLSGLTFYISTLGCKINIYESEAVTNALINNGLILSKNPGNAKIIIINSCSVTEKAGAKTRYEIRRLKRINKKAFIVVCGCLVNTDKEEISKLEEIDLIITNSDKDKIHEALSFSFSNTTLTKPYFFSTQIDGSFNFNTDKISNHTRAFIKIQDGCNNFCSYCKIPYARGKEQSRNTDDIINEINFLQRNGFEEFILSGINIGSYNYGGKNLSGIINILTANFSQARFRISSIEPQYIDDLFLKAISAENICPHFHVPLQSGSDKILHLMNRRYAKKEFLDKINKLREVKTDPFISTDLIFGFPKEDDNDFLETVDFIEQIDFAFIHLFRFSPNALSSSKNIFPKVPERIAAERVNKAKTLISKLNLNYRKKFIGRNLSALIEKKNRDSYAGKSENYLNITIDKPEKILEIKKRYNIKLTEIVEELNYGILIQ